MHHHRSLPSPLTLSFVPTHALCTPACNGIRVHLPIARPQAAVRAMDCTTEFMNRMHGGTILDFIVGGASKRGWTTWTTAAVDKRVVAATPIVMGMSPVGCAVLPSPQ